MDLLQYLGDDTAKFRMGRRWKGSWTRSGPCPRQVRTSFVSDILGLSDYGLRYSPHLLHHLKAGFRVIVPDLPSYGRSTGVHSYLPSLDLLPAALHAVLTDVMRNDLANSRNQRKVFLSGA